jgi:hypothetical protein
MRHKNIVKMGVLLLVIFTFFTSPLVSSQTYVKTNNNPTVVNDKGPLDSYLIYNITENLSNIIFTEYDEENGEIAKGRAWGTKGELRAIEIIAENFSKIGLNVTLEKIKERPGRIFDDNAYKLEVLDYEVRLNDKKIECYIAPSWIGPRERRKLDTTFNYSDLKIIETPRIPCLFRPKYAFEKEDFVFIINDQWNDPNYSLLITDLLKPFLDPLKLYMEFHIRSLFNIQRQTLFWRIFYPRCKGFVLYDFNPDCYDMIYFGGPYKNYLPVIFINGSHGSKIMENPDDYRISYDLKQRYNRSVISYNVIGELNRTEDPTKTVIVCSLIDSWWNQGTADSAIGMAMVVAIAKYYQENNLTPNYNMKFIGFGGEEYDTRGPTYYEALHKDENIIYMIDLNQVGFTQNEPRLAFDITSNDKALLDEIWEVAKRTEYVKRTGDSADIKKVCFFDGTIPSNPYPFVIRRPKLKAVSFFKNGGWILHHRDGLNHTEGDVFKYFNWTDVNITGELVLNITKYLTIEKEIIGFDNTNSIDVELLAKDS